MYTLYYLPGACSLATQVVIHELDQAVEIINKQEIDDFTDINPVGTVPVLLDNGKRYQEGAAIMLHLLAKHPSTMFPTSADAREQAIQNILFANATMHPAYGRLFFIAQNIDDERVRQSAFDSAAQAIDDLWKVVEGRLSKQRFLGGDHVSAADIMLSVYSRWAEHFPVQISLGPKTQNMIDSVIAMPSFQLALSNEQNQQAA